MPINATFHGFVETTTDSLLLFEACRRGVLPKISRRLQERERGSIKSGTVFIFDEKESGIKRWTDGLIWSPSRILGNFLIYRELGGRESLNDKCSSTMNSNTNYHNKNNHDMHLYNNYNPHQRYNSSNNNNIVNSNNQYDYYQTHSNNHIHQQQQQQQQYAQQNNHLFYQEQIPESIVEEYDEIDIEDRNKERNLVGSLTDTYKFRKGGLIKKTLSIHLNGCTQHMISYYTKEDVLKCRLATPSSIPAISCLQISPELLLKQSFRVPPSVEFAEMALKRPSLSPSSTSTSTTSSTTSMSSHPRKMSSTGNTGNHPYHPYHQPQHHPSSYENEVQQSSSIYQSRRAMNLMESLSPPLPSNPRKFTRKMVDDNASDLRRSSYHSLDNTTSNVSSLDINNNDMNSNANKTPSPNNFRSLFDDIYETPSSYQNVSEKPFYDNSNRGKIQRRHSNNISSNSYYNNPTTPVVSRRQNSCHFSSSPPNLINYHQQRIHEIPTISTLPSHSVQQQQQASCASPPILSPSRFLWSANNSNDDQSITTTTTTTTTSPHPSTSRTFTPLPPSSSPQYNYTKSQQQHPLATITTSSMPSNNSLPRCFEGNNICKLAANSTTSPTTSFYNNHHGNTTAAVIQDNLYLQQQQPTSRYNTTNNSTIYHHYE